VANDELLVRALRGVLRDHGWRLVADPDRLRATLSDVLGTDAPELRGYVDALVVAAEHGLPAAVEEPGVPATELMARLESWGLSAERAAWAVATWTSVTPRRTDPAPGTDPAPDQPEPSAHPRPAPADAALPVTALPPVEARTALPSAPPSVAPSVHTSESPRSAWRRKHTVVAALVVAALAATGGTALVVRHGHDRHPTTPSSLDARAKTPPPADGTELVTDPTSTPRQLGRAVAMAAEDVGVRLSGLSDVPEARIGKRTVGPPPGGRLIAFSLDRWACQSEKSCGPGGKVHVEVDGQRRPLRGGGPYVVAVPADATAVDLVMTANHLTQRISLLTGRVADGNVEVLARDNRTLDLHRHFDVSQTTSIPIYYIDGHDGTYHHTMNVTMTQARLDYFLDGKTPSDAQHAFLYVDYWFTYDEDPQKQKHHWVFGDESVLTFVARDGTRYRARDIDQRDDYAMQVFEVPASLQGGRFVIGGPQEIAKHADNGRAYTMRYLRHSEQIRF
jgi:hypothetical protein